MGPNFDENDGDFFDAKWVVGTGRTRWTGTEQAKESITYKLGNLKNILLGCLIINSDNVIPLLQRTNNRVYRAFQTLDTQLQTAMGGAYAGSDFAGRYKSYMQDRATLFNKAPNLAIRMIDNIQTDLQQAVNLPDVNSQERGSLALLLASYKSLYTIGNNAQQWQFQINFEWDVNNVKRDQDAFALAEFHKLKNLVNRQATDQATGGDGGSCPLTVPASASLPPASGFATGVITNGGGGGGSGGSNPSQTGLQGTPSATGGDGGGGQGSGGSNGPSNTGAQGTPSAAGPTKTPAPTKTKPPTSQSSGPVSCQDDQDCEDYQCDSGDPFCAIAISKNKRHELPVPNKVRRQATKTTADASFPTGFCGCKNQDQPTTTEAATPAPVPSGCDDGGLYDDFDACSAHCAQGLCQENAGQPQITCSCN